MRQTDLSEYFENTNDRDLKRATNSDKEYLYIQVSVFNAEISVNLTCSKHFQHFTENNWNGYDLVVENTEDVKQAIEAVIKNRKIKAKQRKNEEKK